MNKLLDSTRYRTPLDTTPVAHKERAYTPIRQLSPASPAVASYCPEKGSIKSTSETIAQSATNAGSIKKEDT